jgi:hypothetical protein
MSFQKFSRTIFPFFVLAACVAAHVLMMATFAPEPASAAAVGQKQGVEKFLKQHETIRTDAASLAQQVQRTGRLSLDTSGGQQFELDLAPHDMRAENYRAEEVSGDGFVRPVSIGPIRTYRGSVRGLEGAEARFTIDDESIEGMIITRDERYYVEPLSHYSETASKSELIFYRSSDVLENTGVACGATLDERVALATEGLSTKISEQVLAGASREIELATETDYEYVAHFGSSAAADAEILGIMNQIDGLYQTQLGMRFKVVYQHTWATSSDPYNSTTGTEMLGEFTDYWNANISQPRDIAHMWTDRTLDGGSLAGIAWTGIACRDAAHAYGVSIRLGNVLKYTITAHEIGHNFGAAHPDQQVPPVAACAGTVMNSIVGTNLNFCQFSQDQINAYVSSNSSCLAGQSPQMTFQFSAPDYTVDEGAGHAVINVTRTGDTSVDATVDYATTKDGASPQTDYNIAAGTLRFAPGETSKTFNVILTDDLYVENQEIVDLSLSNPTGGGALGLQSIASLIIVDNDVVQPLTNPLDGAPFFIRQHYLDFLGREPDAGGLGYWTNQLTQCGTDAACLQARRVGVADAFFFEPEFQQTGGYVYRIIKAATGVRPNFAQFNADRGSVQAGAGLDQSKSDYARSFVGRDAFLQMYPRGQSATQFVDALLATINANSHVDLNAQRNALVALYDGTDAGRGKILRQAADSQAFVDAEYNSSFVLMEYFGYLRRDPDQGGYDFWLGQVNKYPLRNLGIQHAMACSFITSAEYQLRFSPVVTHTNRECSP